MNYPFIKLTFTKDDSTYDVRREFIVKDSLVFDYKLLNGIDPSSNRVQFQLTKDCPINEKIIGSDKDVKAQVCYWDYDTGVPIVKFTGYISNNFKWGVNEYGKSVLNITLEDIGTRKFKKPFNKEKAEVLKGTLNEVINIICQRMQIERADKLAPETQVICVISKGKKVEEILKTLVKENVYTYYFDENGKFNLYPINYSKNVWDYNIKKDTLYAKQGEAISFSKSPKQYTHSEVEWKKYAKVPNITVLRDGNGKDDSHPNCNIIVKGYETYPAKDNGKPANIKATDLNSGKEIVYIENLTYDINTPIGDFTKTVGIHDDLKSIKIAITNNSASDGQIEKLECYADAMLVQGSATAYGVPEGDLNLDTYKTKSEWLHDEAPNKKYAEFLALYYAYCNHSYTFYTKENMELGKVCKLQDETFSGLDVNVLLTSKRGVDGGIYTYTGFATTQFNIAEVGNDGVTFPDIYPEGVPGPPGPPGEGIKSIEEFWQVSDSDSVIPTIWETSIPTLTIEKRFLWYYKKTSYTDGRVIETKPSIISVYSDTTPPPQIEVVCTSSETLVPANQDGVIKWKGADPSFVFQVREIYEGEVWYYSAVSTIEACASSTGTFFVKQGHSEGVSDISHGINNNNMFYKGPIFYFDPKKGMFVMPGETGYATFRVFVNDGNKLDNVSAEYGLRSFYFNHGFVKIREAAPGKDGNSSRTVFQYKESSSATDPDEFTNPYIKPEWRDTMPTWLYYPYLWMRSQTTGPDGVIQADKWGTPVLISGDFKKVMATIENTNDRVTQNTAAIEANSKEIGLKLNSQTFTDYSAVTDAAIKGNTDSIAANGDAIAANGEAIKNQGDLIKNNEDAIASQQITINSYGESITAQGKKIQIAEETLVTQGEAIDANTGNITANGELIQKNTTSIEANAKEISTKVSSTTFENYTKDNDKKFETVSSEISQTADRIALTVSKDGTVHPNSKNGASIVIGMVDDAGYIVLDAPDIIAPGTITANEINTLDLYSNIIEVGDRIVSGGYREVDEKGNINPRNLPGFYADASGTVKMIDAEIKGTIDSDILTTINGIPEISSSNISPEYKTFWNDAQAVFDPEEWYETPQHVGLPENSMSASLVSMGGSLFYENSYSEYGLYRSDDLYSWTRVSDYDVKLIDYQNGEYYGWVLDNPKSVEVRDHYLAKSATGSSWTKINTPYIHYYENFNSKLLTPNIWLLLTDARYGQTQYNYYSTDKGETWNSLTFFNNTGYSGVYGVYGNGKFIVSADVYSSDDPDSWRIFESTDGINWTKIGSIPQKEGSYYNYKIKFDNGYFYKINSSRSGSSIDYSTDGINWKTKTGLIGDFTALKYIPEVGLWVARGKNYILYSPTINGEYKAVYTSAFGSCNVSYPVFADNKIIFLLNNRSNNGMSFYYCSKWARGGITNFFSRIIPKIAPGNRAPTYEPLWDLQSCTGGYVYGNITGQLSKIKSAPNELILIDTNGSVLTFNTKRPIEAPLQITNLVIKQIQAIAYLGNVLPKDSNVNLGTNDNRFRTIYAMNLYGSLEGNVNSEATRNQFKVWGAVAN